jgi:predicted transcriptional regulator
MRELKRKLYLDIVDSIKKGLNPSKIAVHLNISLPNLSYYLSSLKKEGVIVKKGYGVWEVIPSGEVKTFSLHDNQRLKENRGHAFIWKVKPKKLFNWIDILNTSKVPYEMKGIAKTPRVIINGKKIWLGKEITIYDKNSYFGVNSIESKKLGIWELQELVIAIEKALGIDLSGYQFSCRREHHSIVENSLAIQCDKEGKSILVKNEKGYWMSIDNSLNLHEAEAISKDSLIDALGIQRYFNSHKETNFKVTPTFVLEGFNKLIENQEYHDVNIKSHISAIQILGKAVNDLVEEVKQLKNIHNKGGEI